MRKKFYSMSGEAIDSEGKSHVVTVVGLCTQEKETDIVSENVDVSLWNGKSTNGVLSYPNKKIVRRLKYAFSICHPDDEFDEETGVKLAKRRLSKPLGELKTEYITCLTPEQVNMILFEELNYIIDNIDKFINK